MKKKPEKYTGKYEISKIAVNPVTGQEVTVSEDPPPHDVLEEIKAIHKKPKKLKVEKTIEEEELYKQNKVDGLSTARNIHAVVSFKANEAFEESEKQSKRSGRPRPKKLHEVIDELIKAHPHHTWKELLDDMDEKEHKHVIYKITTTDIIWKDKSGHETIYIKYSIYGNKNKEGIPHNRFKKLVSDRRIDLNLRKCKPHSKNKK